MPKQPYVNAEIKLAGLDISDHCTNVQVETDREQIDVTCFNEDGTKEFALGFKSWTASAEVFQNFGTIESVKAVSDLYAPVTGTVIEVNAALKDSPQDLNQRPHDAWMIKVSLADGGAMVDLMDAAAYAEVAK